jgi:hypothetical protein
VIRFPDLGDPSAREILPLYVVETSALAEGAATRYRRTLFPRWSIALAWTMLDQDARDLVDNHVLAHADARLPFYWFDGLSDFHLWVPVGLGDGVETEFVLPGCEVSDLALYSGAGSAVTATLSAGTGPEGEDVVTASAPITEGHWLWANFAGKRRYTVRFAADGQEPSRHLETGLWSFATRLVSVK